MKWFLYRVLMRVMHRFDLHYAPPHNIQGDIVLRCDWCGLTYTKCRANPFIQQLHQYAAVYEAKVKEELLRTSPWVPLMEKPFPTNIVLQAPKADFAPEELRQIHNCACVHHDSEECARIRDGRLDRDDPAFLRRKCECACHNPHPEEKYDNP